MVVITD